MRQAAPWLPPLLAILAIGAAPDAPFQTLSAFKATVSYRFACTHDVFTVAIEAVSQVPTGGESTLYWEISDSGQLGLGGVQNVATLNTLQVQAAAGAATAHDSGLGVMTDVYRSCSGQSLYVWPASSATTLPNGDVDVRFADAAEQPLSQQ
jgi:hypothetical protein